MSIWLSCATTSLTPSTGRAIIDFEMAVELEDKAVLETLPAAFPLDPRLQTHSKHDRPGIAYRHALADFLASLS